jgi:hypothetical protein
MIGRSLASTALATTAIAIVIASCKHGSETQGPDAPQNPAGAGAAPAIACDEMKTGDFTHLAFGESPAKRGPFDPPPPPPLPAGTGDDVKFLLTRAWRLAKTPAALEKDLIAACTELGLAAGVPENDLKAEPDQGHGAERACNAASTRVAALFRKAKESKVLLDLAVEPTRCFVDVEAAKKCLVACGAAVAGDVRAQCVGGEIDGVCQGRCSGSCALPPGPGAGACHGACSGKCDHDFRGACAGKCSGTCDGAPTRGAKKCTGICDGSCSQGDGTCAGRCDGQCAGFWEPPATGKCAGVCVGVCAGDVKDALCSGEFAPKGPSPSCLAACGAESALSVRCDAPLVRVAVRGGKPTPELEKLLVGIQSAVPKIVRLQQGAAKRLPRAIEVAVAASVDWSNAFATAGKKPLLCIRNNVDALREAAGWIDLAVRGAEAVAPAIKTDPIPQGKAEEE